MATTFSAPRWLFTGSWRSVQMLAVVLALFISAPGARAAFNYGDFAASWGVYQNVSETSITDAVALFGAPSLAGDVLQFMPQSFLASASDGSVDQTVGVLTANLLAAEGNTIEMVLIEELFSYQLTGNGNSAVSIAGQLVLTDLTPGHGGAVYQAPLVVMAAPAPPYTNGPTSGTDWLARAALDLSGLGITQAALTFNDILQATSHEGVTSWIEKTDIKLRVEIPEPASLALLAAGMLAISTRRRIA